MSKFSLSLFSLTACTAVLLAGCKSNPAPVVTTAGQDPAATNVAANGAQVLGANEQYTPQQSSEAYTDTGSYAQTQAPPPQREYQQPESPGANYIWTPGYWGAGPNGYVWVNGSWVQPPYSGALWTPPYWGYIGGRYLFHRGYWGRHVGYYGGVDYGAGYIGTGYYGGYWNGNNFYYNRAVNHVGGGYYGYSRPVISGGVTFGFGPHSFVSFNGGPGGVVYAPRPYEYAAWREEHREPYGVQVDAWQHAGAVPWGGREVVVDHRDVVVEHHDEGRHERWDHRDNGRHEGWDRGDHGHDDHGHH